MSRNRVIVAAFAALALWARAALCEAPAEIRADELVPADCVVYVELSDITRSIERLKTSPLGRIWAEQEVQQFVAEPLAKLKEVVAKREEKIKLDLVSLAGAFKGQVAAALLDVKRGQNDPIFEIVIIADAKGDGAKEIEAVVSELLGRLREIAPEIAVQEYQYGPARVKVLAIGEAEVTWCFAGGMFLAAVNRSNMEKLLDNMDRKGKPLSGVEAFKAVKDRAGRSADLLVFFSGTRFLDKFRAQMGENDAAEFEKSGLGTLDGAAYGLTFSEVGFHEVASAYAPERKGFLKLLDQKPLELAGLKFVPESALGYLAVRIEPKKTWETFQELVGQVGGQRDLDEMKKGVAKLEADLGISVERQITGALAGEIHAYVAFPPMGGAVIPDVVAMAELSDPQAFGQFVEALKVVILAQAKEREPDLAFNTFTYRDRTVFHMKTDDRNSPVALSYCFVDKYLVVASSPPAMKRALIAMDAQAGLNASEKFMTTIGPMGKERSALLYIDTASAFNFGYNSLLPFLQNRPKNETTGFDPNLLPLAQTVSQHFAGWAISFGAAKDGVFIESSGPLPVIPTIIAVGAGAEGAKQVRRAERRRRAQDVAPAQPPAAPNADGGEIF